MSSKRRIRRNQCGSKVKYETAAQARSVAHSLHQKTGEAWQGYRCSFCDGHHVGHMNRKMKQAKARRLEA